MITGHQRQDSLWPDQLEGELGAQEQHVMCQMQQEDHQPGLDQLPLVPCTCSKQNFQKLEVFPSNISLLLKSAFKP
jgi:hypothetical protein